MMKLTATLLTLLLAAATVSAQDGGQVVQGDAVISQPDSTTTIIDQLTDRAVIEWDGFSIDSGHLVRFNQPGSSSAALNRVTGQDPTRILGRLEANGNVFILNPNGILFTPTAQVHVGGLVASTLSLSDSDFMAGNLQLTHDPLLPHGYVVNQGSILADNFVVLAAPFVENTGTIESLGGTVYLLGGTEVSLDISGSGLLGYTIGNTTAGTVRIDGDALSEVSRYAFDRDYVEAGAVIDNGDGTFDLIGNQGAVGNQGTIRAGQGEIVLTSGANGLTGNTGLLEAIGDVGGTVHMFGRSVWQTMGGVIDVSGLTAGGTVLLGGEFQGGGTAPNSQLTYIDSGTAVIADALGNGDGGTIIAWSDGFTRVLGTLCARGGPDGGNGGFVETSGLGLLDVGPAVVDASAPLGLPGEWLLDPYNVTISTDPTSGGTFVGGVFTPTGNDSVINRDTIQAALDAGTSVTVNTGVGGAQAGNITVDDSITKSIGGATTLTLDAANDITIDASISGPGLGVLDVVLLAGGAIRHLTGTISSDDLVMRAVSGISRDTGTLDVGRLQLENTGSGNIEVVTTGSVELDDILTLGFAASNPVGGIQIGSIGGTSDILISADVTTSGGNIFLTTVGTGADLLHSSGAITSGGGDVTLHAGQHITLTGMPIVSGGGAIFATAGLSSTTTGSLAIGDLTSAGGHIIVASGVDGTMTTGDLDSGGGHIDIEPGSGAVSLGDIGSAGGNVRMERTGGSITPGLWSSLTLGSGDLTLITTTADAIDVTGGAFGTSGGDLILRSGGDLLTDALTTAGGSVDLNTFGDLTTGDITTAGGDISVQVLTAAATPTQGTLSTGGGSISIDRYGVLTDWWTALTPGSGNITLRASGPSGSITIGSTVATGGGDITLRANSSIDLTGGGLTSAGGRIDVDTPLTGTFDLGDLSSGGGEIFIRRTGGTITPSNWGTFSNAGGSVTLVTNGDHDIDLSGLALTATGSDVISFRSGADLTTDDVTSAAGGGIVLGAVGTITTGTVGTGGGSITLERAGGDIDAALLGSIGGPFSAITLRTTGSNDISLAGTDLTTTGGAITLESQRDIAVDDLTTSGGDVSVKVSGDLTVLDVTTTGGAATFEMLGAVGDISMGTVSTSAGALTIERAGPINLWWTALSSGGGDLTLRGTGTLGTIDLGSDPIAVTSSGGAILLDAQGTPTFGGRVVANGGIFDSGGGDITLLGTSHINLSGAGGLSSGGGIITVDSPTTGDFMLGSVDSAGGEIFIRRTGGDIDENTFDSFANAGGKVTLMTEGGAFDIDLPTLDITTTDLLTIESSGSIVIGDLDAGTSDLTVNASGGGVTTGDLTTAGGVIDVDGAGTPFTLGAIDSGGGTVRIFNQAPISPAVWTSLATGGADVIIHSWGSIDLTGVTIATTGGSIELDAGVNLITAGLDTDGGDVYARANGPTLALGLIDTDGGTVTIRNTGGNIGGTVWTSLMNDGGAITLETTGANSILLGGASLTTVGAPIEVRAGGSLTMASWDSGGGDITIEAGGPTLLLGSIVSSGGDIMITSHGAHIVNAPTATWTGISNAGGSIIVETTGTFNIDLAGDDFFATGSDELSFKAGGALTINNLTTDSGGKISVAGTTMLLGILDPMGGGIDMELRAGDFTAPLWAAAVGPFDEIRIAATDGSIHLPGVLLETIPSGPITLLQDGTVFTTLEVGGIDSNGGDIRVDAEAGFISPSPLGMFLGVVDSDGGNIRITRSGGDINPTIWTSLANDGGGITFGTSSFGGNSIDLPGFDIVTAGEDVVLDTVNFTPGDFSDDGGGILIGSIMTAGGSITATAAGDIRTTGAAFSSGGGDIAITTVDFGGNNIALDDVDLLSGGGTIDVTSVGDVSVGEVHSGGGAVSFDAAGTVDTVGASTWTTGGGDLTMVVGDFGGWDIRLENVDITTGGGTLDLTSSGDIRLAHVTTGGGDLILFAEGNIHSRNGSSLGGPLKAARWDSGGGNISLTSEGIFDNALDAVDFMSRGGSITLDMRSGLTTGNIISEGGDVTIRTSATFSEDDWSKIKGVHGDLTVDTTRIGDIDLPTLFVFTDGTNLSLTSASQLEIAGASTSGGDVTLGYGTGTPFSGLGIVSSGGGGITVQATTFNLEADDWTTLDNVGGSLTFLATNASTWGIDLTAAPGYEPITWGSPVTINSAGNVLVDAITTGGGDITIVTNSEFSVPALGVLDTGGGGFSFTRSFAAIDGTEWTTLLSGGGALTFITPDAFDISMGGTSLTAINNPITLTSGANLTVDSIDTGGGDITLDAAGDITVGDLTAECAAIHVQADSDGDGAGTVTQTAASLWLGESLFVGAADGITAAGGAPLATTVSKFQVALVGPGGTVSGEISIADTESMFIADLEGLGYGARNESPAGGLTITTVGDLWVAAHVQSTGGMPIDLSTTDGDIQLWANIEGGTGTVTLTAGGSGSIVDDRYQDTAISTTSSITLSAAGGAIGSHNGIDFYGAIDVRDGYTGATASALDDVWVSQVDGNLATSDWSTFDSTGVGSTLGLISLVGNLTVDNTLFSGKDDFIVLFAGIDLLISNDIDTTASDLITPTPGIWLLAERHITMTAGTVSAPDRIDFEADTDFLGNADGIGAISQTGGSILTSDLVASAGSGIRFDSVDVDRFQATNTTSGDISLTDADTLELADIDGLGYAIMNVGSGDISITTLLGDLTVSADVTTGTGRITLDSVSGALTQTGGVISGGQLVAGGATGITLPSTAVGSLQANNTVSGDVTITNDGSVTIASLIGGPAASNVAGGDITIETTSGDITIAGDVTTPTGRVTLTSAGAILQTGGTVTAAELLLTADTGISLTSTAVAALQATNVTSGDISISNSGDLTLSDLDTLGYAVSNPAGDITISTSGDLLVDALVTGGVDVSLSAGGELEQSLTGDVMGATVTFSAGGDILLGYVEATGRADISAGGSILDNNDTVPGILNVLAGADSFLGAGGTVGTALNCIEVDITGRLVVRALSAVDGVSVNICGTVTDGDTLAICTPTLFAVGDVIFNGSLVTTPSECAVAQINYEPRPFDRIMHLPLIDTRMFLKQDERRSRRSYNPYRRRR